MIDLKKFYFENVQEEEYYYRFYNFIKNIDFNASFELSENDDYIFEVYDADDAIVKFKELCQPEIEFGNYEMCVGFIL